MHAFYYPLTSTVLHGKILLLPIVSAANLGQLAVDLVISSLDLHLIGLFNPKDVIPVVGARDNGEEGITTPLELFGKEGIDIVVLQQRSPALKDRKDIFVQDLLTFIQDSKFATVLLLSGVDMSNRTDNQMLTPTYYIYPPNSPSWDSTPLSTLEKLPISTYSSPISQRPFSAPVDDPAQIPFIPGGGLTRRIITSLPQHWATPIASILQFVLEGDNRGDAMMMASVVSKVLGFDSTIASNGGWKEPKSWDKGLFGTPHDQTLYG